MLIVIGVVVFFCVGAFMFYSGLVGGGDAKFIIGVGALLALLPRVAAWPFLFTLWVNMMLCGAGYGLVYTAGLAVKHWKRFSSEFSGIVKRYKWMNYVFVAGFFCGLILYLFGINTGLLVYGIAVLMFYMIVFAKAVEDSCMYKFVSPKKLTEGDWIAEDVVFNKKVVYKPARLGIEKKDIEKLVSIKGLKKVKIKDGIPYMPGLLIGVIASLIIGDLMYLLVQGILG